MVLLFCGFNNSNTCLNEKFAMPILCQPLPATIPARQLPCGHEGSLDSCRNEATQEVEDILFTKEKIIWLSGSAWMMLNPSLQEECYLKQSLEITSSSDTLGVITKNNGISLVQAGIWQELTLSFSSQTRNHNFNSECSTVKQHPLNAAKQKSLPQSVAIYKSRSNMLQDTTLTLNDSFASDGAYGLGCDSSPQQNDETDGLETKNLKPTFKNLKLLENRIILLDVDGDTWEGNVTNTSLCTVTPLLLRHAVAEVAVGAQHCILRTAHGEIFTYGCGMKGELGAGDLKYCDSPRPVTLLEGIHIKKVAAGAWHCLALGVLGEVFVWGWNVHGQLGLPCKPGATAASMFGCDPMSRFSPCGCTSSLTPTYSMLSPPTSCVATSPESQSELPGNCAVTDKCPFNDQSPENYGDIKTPASYDSAAPSINSSLLCKKLAPKKVDCINVQSWPVMLEAFGDKDVLDIAAGDRHSLFLLDGRVWSCGWNKYGQCGVCWREGEVRALAPIPGLSGVRKLWAGFWCSAFSTSLPTHPKN
ncbi:uncharacterized protein LOC108665523 isoform X2 [Hyalella azteca]|uniref:Uncharacterized protein LOC108665523 isoform X2 n=1 Tax=Hyalella azteca TaxID=294128 RepID=A0A8B7N1Q1_HYAAZ|nr:uncharacterized protein LOC108665523 isoform X2 [Hyalella azteca]